MLCLQHKNKEMKTLDYSDLKKGLTIADLKEQQLIIYEAIVGSTAYGTNGPNSDIDKKGIFILPYYYHLAGIYIPQVADEKNDNVYYELLTFMKHIINSNPGSIELLNVLTKFVTIYNPEYMQPLFDYREKLVTKQLKQSFGNYAITQIKKARGNNKKIVNPVDKERKTPLDFCYIMNLETSGTTTLRSYLDKRNMNPDNCGLISLNNARDCYMLFYSEEIPYKGVINKDGTSNEIRLSSIPKGEVPIANMIYNKDGYVKHCKDYKEYWDWVEKRNEDRYQTNISHGAEYDSKNLGHCVRLVKMCIEIARQKKVNVWREDSEFLLKVKGGHFKYDEIMQIVDELVILMDEAFEQSDLPENVNVEEIVELFYNINTKFQKDEFGN